MPTGDQAVQLRCGSCGTHFDLQLQTAACPLCGSTHLERREVGERREGFRLSFGVYACDECSATFVNRGGDTHCPQCGAVQDSTDQHVQQRMDAFGTDLIRLQERLEFAHDEPISSRGDRRTQEEYKTWLVETLLPEALWRADRLVPLMSHGDFNQPESPDTKAAWTGLLELANEVIDTSLAVKRRPGPAEFLGSHHGLVTGLLIFASGVVGYLTTLTAPTPSVAQQRAHEAQTMLDESGSSLARAAGLTHDDDDTPESPSGRTMVSIFPELAGLAELDPVMLRPLLPMARLSRRSHDAERRGRRVDAVTSVLDRAAAVDGRWLDPFDSFLNSCGAAWRKLVAQHERLTRAFDDDRTRTGWVDDVMDVGSKLAEGPFRIYGGLIVLAGKIVTGDETAATEESVMRYRRLSAVVKGLGMLDPVFVAGVEGLVRNAEAHYDYEVLSNGVEIRHLPPRQNSAPLIDFLTFDDLLVSVLNLHEVSLAMAAGTLGWVWRAGTVGAREAFRRDWLTA